MPIRIKLLRWHRNKLEENIRMEFKETIVHVRCWIDSTQDRNYWRAFVNTTLNLRVPQATEPLITSLKDSAIRYYVTRHKLICLRVRKENYWMN